MSLPSGAAGPFPPEPSSPPSLGARWLSAKPVVRAYLLAATGNGHDAEELLARVALAVVAKAGDFDPAKPFGPWAMGMAKIEVLRFRRDHARNRLCFGEAALAALETAFAKIEAEADPRLAALTECLKLLAGKAGEAIRLTYVQGLAGAQAAQQMGIAAGHFFVLLSRARTQLRRCIEAKLSSPHQP